MKTYEASKEVFIKFSNCLISNEEALIEKVLEFAITYGYAKYTSTLKEAWRISISGLTNSFVSAVQDKDFVVELGPDQDFRNDPVADFAIVEAQRHRRRGIRLEMFLGFLKYYRQAYQDVILNDDSLLSDEKEICGYIADRLFDRIEIGFCAEWSGSSATHVDELQENNRIITNEKNKYLTIFESLPFPVLLLNANSQIENQNHAATIWLGGYSIPGSFYYGTKLAASINGNSTLSNKPVVHQVPGWLVPEIEAFIAEDGRQYNSFEKEIENDDDQLLLFVQLSKMLDVSGKFAGCVVMVADLTEARKAEIERARMKEQLLQSDKMASIGQLASGVAHEINNPIGFIASNLNRLGEYTSDMTSFIDHCKQLIETIASAAAFETKFKLAIARIHEIESEVDIPFLCEDIKLVIAECKDGANRVRQIVADLKDFAHPGVEKPQEADINNCLDSSVNMLRNELKYKVSLVKEYDQIPQVKCYPRQLNQVFMNILANAAQAIEKKGEIRISTRMHADAIQIRISDTGSGMAPDQVKRIFEPFFTTKPIGSGTGLGLHIAYQIIQQHQGNIYADSEPGQGTTFTICLPLNPNFDHVTDACRVQKQ
ncbi:MAG: GHKL domain-containing protein [Desulfatitalea sp.]|nr:GHKL domain-containing protein [Desulfatitalea sp.]NNK02726.1 GHKL domain-containing protein [Desulfatitalea sp.]